MTRDAGQRIAGIDDVHAWRGACEGNGLGRGCDGRRRGRSRMRNDELLAR